MNSIAKSPGLSAKHNNYQRIAKSPGHSAKSSGLILYLVVRRVLQGSSEIFSATRAGPPRRRNPMAEEAKGAQVKAEIQRERTSFSGSQPSSGASLSGSQPSSGAQGMKRPRDLEDATDKAQKERTQKSRGLPRCA